MPDMSIPPINQCTFDDPTDGAGPLAAPSGAPSSPDTTEVRPCFDGPPGVEGGGDECADELVQRYNGQGGAANAEQALAGDGSWQCADEVLRAVAVCGAVLAAAPGTAGVSLFLGGVGCGATLMSLDECIEATAKR